MTKATIAEKIEKKKEVHALLNAFDDIYKGRTILLDKVNTYTKNRCKNIGTLLLSSSFIVKHQDLVEKKKLFAGYVPVGEDHHLAIILKETDKKLKIFKTKCPKCTRPNGSLEIEVKRNIYFKPDPTQILAYDSRVYSQDMDKKFIENCLNAFDEFLKEVCA